jgi:hypothetical protein
VLSQPYYLFSIGRHIIHKYPYRQWTVYILPRETFQPEPPFPFGGMLIHTAQLASLEPVAPVAKVTVVPEDFPFLHQMLAHDDDRLEEYAAAIRSGQPWPGERGPQAG